MASHSAAAQRGLKPDLLAAPAVLRRDYFSTPQEAALQAHLAQMVIRRAVPPDKPQMQRLILLNIANSSLESVRSSAAYTAHFSLIAIPAGTRTGSPKLRPPLGLHFIVAHNCGRRHFMQVK